MRQMRQKLFVAAGCLVCAVVCWKSFLVFEGTEFGGGSLAGNQVLASFLFILMLALAFKYPRSAAISALVACVFSLPLYLYLVFPRPFRQVWPGDWKVSEMPERRLSGMDGELQESSSLCLWHASAPESLCAAWAFVSHPRLREPCGNRRGGRVAGPLNL